jgi:methylmalonyl-CoA mutase C-terminal domain/subunit
MELLKEKGLTGVKVFVGGIVPDEDIPNLKAIGVSEIFGPGTSTETIVETIRAAVTK